jgi:hypothetical protein
VSVEFATADGSAHAGRDYQATAGDIVFPPGVVARAVEVRVTGDTTAQGDRTFFVRFRLRANGRISTRQAKATIVDDDRQ